MFREIKSELLKLTPELANRIATMEAFIGERPAKLGRLEFLKSKLADGIFHSPRWAVAILNGRAIRVNGQHSSRVLIENPALFPKNLTCNLQTFHCDTNEDLADLFQQFDAPESNRGERDRINASRSIHPELANVSTTTANVAAAGIAFALADGVSKLGSDARCRFLGENVPFVLWIDGYVGQSLLRRAPVVACMYRGWRASPEVATEFWNEVRDASNPDFRHATRTLNEFLLMLRGTGGIRSGNMQKWGPRAVYVKCIHAWNAAQKNQTTSLSYVERAPIPSMWIRDTSEGELKYKSIT
jgi:hypothetical protein